PRASAFASPPEREPPAGDQRHAVLVGRGPGHGCPGLGKLLLRARPQTLGGGREGVGHLHALGSRRANPARPAPPFPPTPPPTRRLAAGPPRGAGHPIARGHDLAAGP